MVVWSFWIFALINISLSLFGLYSIFLLFLCLLGLIGLAEVWISKFINNNGYQLNLRLFVLSTAIIISIIEIGLRFDETFDSYPEKTGSLFYSSPYHQPLKPSKSWIHIRKPNSEKIQDCQEYIYELKTNNEGLRDIEHPINKKKNDFRIIALGDSFTEGVGVTALEDTWVKVLERKLNEQFPNKKTTIINAGISSSDPFFELVLLKQKLLKYNPDVVLMTLNQSDIDEIIQRGGEKRFLQNKTVRFNAGPWFEPVFGMSYIVRILVHKVFGLNWLFLDENEQMYKSESAVSQIRKCVNDLQKIGEHKGFKTIAIIQPVREDLEIKEKGNSNIKNVFPVNASVLTLDMIDFFKSKNADSNLDTFYWPIDQHFTKNGNLLFALGLEEFLINSRVLK